MEYFRKTSWLLRGIQTGQGRNQHCARVMQMSVFHLCWELHTCMKEVELVKCQDKFALLLVKVLDAKKFEMHMDLNNYLKKPHNMNAKEISRT